MNYLSDTNYRLLTKTEKLHYLAKAKIGRTKRIFRVVDGHSLPFWQPSIRKITVSKKEYNNPSDAKNEAQRILETIKTQIK